MVEVESQSQNGSAHLKGREIKSFGHMGEKLLQCANVTIPPGETGAGARWDKTMESAVTVGGTSASLRQPRKKNPLVL